MDDTYMYHRLQSFAYPTEVECGNVGSTHPDLCIQPVIVLDDRSLPHGYSDKMSPDKMSRTSCPGQNVPGQNVPGQKVPGQKVPGYNVPGQNVPGQKVPGQKVPG